MVYNANCPSHVAMLFNVVDNLKQCWQLQHCSDLILTVLQQVDDFLPCTKPCWTEVNFMSKHSHNSTMFRNDIDNRASSHVCFPSACNSAILPEISSTVFNILIGYSKNKETILKKILPFLNILKGSEKGQTICATSILD